MSQGRFLNVASRLSEMSMKIPGNVAVAQPMSYGPDGKRIYKTITFQELDRNSDRIAKKLIEHGVRPGMRLALMVRQGIDFTTLVFAILKAGALIILIDPGMGMKRMISCLAEVEPDGFLAIPAVHAVRVLMKWRFPKARHNITVGRRWFWGGLSLEKIVQTDWPGPILVETQPEDPSAIIFTSGSTGPPKGVWYTHRIFDTQIEEIAKRYGIKPGDVDLAGFPFFGLFNAVMGTTAVIPDMDPTCPAQVNPVNICEAVRDWNVNQSFGSPALWNKVADYCLNHEIQLTTLKRVISAGAPVPAHLLARLKRCILPDGNVYTPYGATESLPVASISASEVLGETAEKTDHGAGICVGTKFSTIQWRIIKISDEPIATLEDAEILPTGQIGEIAVTGPQVTQKYVTRLEANTLSKMKDAEGRIWHRMGDVGYLDEQDRFWFCGRKAHRLETERGPIFTIPCEAIFNRHPLVNRSALVGRGPLGKQIPVIFVEPKPGSTWDQTTLTNELRALGKSSPLTESIEHFLFLESFPVDVRHNAKINRELLKKKVDGGCKR